MVYDVKLSKNNFENFFLIDTSNFELNFIYFSDLDIAPKLYYIDNELGTKNIVPQLSKTINGISSKIQWEKTQGINVKDMIRLEW
jgi:hypothetical protein